MSKILFIRHKRGVELTPESHHLYPIAKRLLGELSDIKTIFNQDKFTNKIKIGIAESLPQEHKQHFFKTAHHLTGSVEWDVHPIGRNCELNLLVREWKFEEDLFLPLWKEDYVLCIPNGHHLLKKDIINLKTDLQDVHFIHCPPCEAHQQCLSILSAENMKVTTVANCSTKTETLTLLMAGIGITFLPKDFIDGWYGFETRPYIGPTYYREVGLSYPRKSLTNPAIANLIEHFSKQGLKSVKR